MARGKQARNCFVRSMSNCKPSITLTLSIVPMAMQTNLAGGIVARITVKLRFGAGWVYTNTFISGKNPYTIDTYINTSK